jgi:poly-gamma-glutamate synthesis protein (capsule biosynthesis protein)
MKITFIGDIMIEPPVLAGARQPDGSYDFYPVFAHAQKLFDEADLLIGNLETPLAGPEALYTQHYYAFNAPDAYADAVKKAGFHMVSTANNHTFDRGFAGAERTLKVLDEKGIGHHGSFAQGAERPEAYYMEKDGVKVAVIAYTYGTNYSGSGLQCLAEGEKEGTVNLLRPQKETVYQPGVFRQDWVDKLFPRMRNEKRGDLKKLLGMPTNFPRADDCLDKRTMAPYVEKFQADIRKAKENADIVVFYPHVGGQFNPRPGAISEYVMDKGIQAGADAIMASHSHMLQKALLRHGIPCAYSLGNFNMDPLSSLVLPEFLPYYGLAVHLYVEGKKILKTTFSILKMTRKKGQQTQTWPVDELYETLDEKGKAQLEAEVAKVYGMVNEMPLEAPVIRREYELTNKMDVD